MAGPAKTPDIVNKIKGNPGKRKLKNNATPKSNSTKISTPDHLNKTGQYWFKKLAEEFNKIGLIENIDRLAMELLVESYVEYRAHCKSINENGYIYQTTSTAGEIIVKANPVVAMKSDAWKRLKSMMEQFGMTPSARTKIEIKQDNDYDPLEEFLNSRK